LDQEALGMEGDLAEEGDGEVVGETT